MNKVPQTMAISAMVCLTWAATAQAASAMTVDSAPPTAATLPHMPEASQMPWSGIPVAKSPTGAATWGSSTGDLADMSPGAVSPARCIIMGAPA
ncbi:hypothetical protein SAMN05216499_10387 [Actinacidiphila paucisporea]|uniref:Uncharacterized protein n=1 Tax=Actinacidiphila paucisporea TaxID=310782 RepID=A0A1M6YQQ7_9ACTN|nr:hypothetical protein SAMN05216499_10387 [Actinacidiphila paucisporea]